MEVNKRKDNLVKLLLNKDFDIRDEDELVEMLLDSPIAIDSDKEEDAKRSLGDKIGRQSYCSSRIMGVYYSILHISYTVDDN